MNEKPTEPPPRDVLELLRGVLAEAERGEVKGIAVCYVDSQNRIPSFYAIGAAATRDMIAGAALLLRETTAMLEAQTLDSYADPASSPRARWSSRTPRG